MKKIYQYIIENTIHGQIEHETSIKLIENLKKSKLQNTVNEKIAVIGMAAHYPTADNLDEFWELISGRQDCMGEFPENRMEELGSYIKAKYHTEDKDAFQRGGYLSVIDQFDHNFFRIPPKEADIMDPNQRIFLQTAYEALEDAGYGGQAIRGSKTGVFLGYSSSLRDHYSNYVMGTDSRDNPVSVQGNLESIIASRLSYFLDLKGPSITIDTACSSSLVAVNSAIESLRKKESDLAVASGMKINLYLMENGLKLGIESPQVKTRAFDNEADGVGLGEGIGVVVLKRYEDAVKDHDQIYALIIGSAVNQDGYSAGITVPNVSSQEKVLIDAWNNAGISPETLGYIEAHGTGTKIGDPIEVEALTKAFCQFTSRKQFCALGSVKSNIGHLFEGAGMASFIKSILCLKNKMLPPGAHIKIPNEKIDWVQSPVYVCDCLTEWDNQTYGDSYIPRRCGVSSFGLSGTNCHLVLEEYNPKEEIPVLNYGKSTHLFVLSSQNFACLQKLAEKYKLKVENKPDMDLDAMCEILYLGRGHYNHRLAFCFETISELHNKLYKFVKYGLECQEEDIVYREIIRSKEYHRDGVKVCVSDKDIAEKTARATVVLKEGNIA